MSLLGFSGTVCRYTHTYTYIRIYLYIHIYIYIDIYIYMDLAFLCFRTSRFQLVDCYCCPLCVNKCNVKKWKASADVGCRKKNKQHLSIPHKKRFLSETLIESSLIRTFYSVWLSNNIQGYRTLCLQLVFTASIIRGPAVRFYISLCFTYEINDRSYSFHCRCYV